MNKYKGGNWEEKNNEEETYSIIFHSSSEVKPTTPFKKFIFSYSSNKLLGECAYRGDSTVLYKLFCASITNLTLAWSAYNTCYLRVVCISYFLFYATNILGNEGRNEHKSISSEYYRPISNIRGVAMLPKYLVRIWLIPLKKLRYSK